MSHPPPPPVDYLPPPHEPKHPWRPLWLRLLLPLRLKSLVRADEARRKRYHNDSQPLRDE